MRGIILPPLPYHESHYFMKFNWGTGIAIFSACFMLMILGFVFNSFSHRTQLVSEDYYQQELAYQERIEQTGNAQEIDSEVAVAYQNGELQLQYPAADWQGKVTFFRPSNNKLDFSLPIAMDEAQVQNIRNAKLLSGLWRMRFSWESAGKKFYREQSMVIP